jgi:hypothetical protein
MTIACGKRHKYIYFQSFAIMSHYGNGFGTRIARAMAAWLTETRQY